MVRKYIRKTKRADYPKESLNEAVQQVRLGDMTLRSASAKYKIPSNTIRDHVKRTRDKSQTLGRTTAIPIAAEAMLLACMKTMEKNGSSLSKDQVIEIVAQYIEANNIATPFKKGIPGTDWYINFRKRHNLPISKRKPRKNLKTKNNDLQPTDANELSTSIESNNDLQPTSKNDSSTSIESNNDTQQTNTNDLSTSIESKNVPDLIDHFMAELL